MLTVALSAALVVVLDGFIVNPESQAETVPISPKEEGACLPRQKA
jgi:hypothetical protein